MIINKLDNVEINIDDGHKYALRDIKQGENIIKYGSPIGHATCDIARGEHVHTHNVKTNLSGNLTYEYNYKDYGIGSSETSLTIDAYVRENGDIGIRNEIWIVNLVGCVNRIAQSLADKTGARCFPHPYGCSQLGDDQTVTQLILRGMVNHPNAGGVLVLGLGCENNNIDVFKAVLGEYNPRRVKFLNCQDAADEIAEGIKLIRELQEYASAFRREPVHISRLRVGLKCGGSDGYSGISANPLVGALSDRLISYGGSCVLTVVPEMFGADALLQTSRAPL